MVHPIGTLALSSAASEGAARKVDTNWQKTSFSTTPAITPAMLCFCSSQLNILRDIFSSLLPVPKIDIVTMHDATSASCFGALVVSEGGV
uniref:Uncharacterized protein n=1 Tax=Caenorhabditis japonica TaxID=281687 RepID=A0A8R1IHE7_CAEJA